MFATIKSLLDKLLNILGNIKRILTIGLTTTQKIEIIVQQVDSKIPDTTPKPQ